MKGRVGSVPEISVFPTEISVSGVEILPYEHFIPVNEMNGGMNSGSADGIVFFASCIFHIINIPFNCSDTAFRVTDAKIGPKVKILCFAMFALFLNLAPELVPRIFDLFSSRKPV